MFIFVFFRFLFKSFSLILRRSRGDRPTGSHAGLSAVLTAKARSAAAAALAKAGRVTLPSGASGRRALLPNWLVANPTFHLLGGTDGSIPNPYGACKG